MDSELLHRTFWGNELQEWLLALLALVVTVVVLRVGRLVIQRRIKAFAGHTETPWDDVFVRISAKTRFWLVLLAGLYVGSTLLELPERARGILSHIFVIGLIIQAGIWGGSFVVDALTIQRKKTIERDPGAVTSLNILGITARVVVWATAVLLILDNLGINITTLVAGLGIGGVAVALAIQNILGDLFASLSILMDKPFVVGDFLIIDDHLGSVEKLGIKTTRLRSLSGEQLIFANSDLLKSRIHNYGRMFERRVVLSLGVTYQTPREKLKKIPSIIREAIEAQEHTRFDRAHFMNYGDFALKFESVYFVLSPDYNLFMDVQQAILLIIHENFERENIEFAYPTQTVFVAQDA